MVIAKVAQYTQEQFDKFIAGMKYPPNKFQLAVLESIAFREGNMTVDAKAGAGKTQLLIMIASLLLDMGVDPSEVIFQAFNKSIEEELNARLPKGFTAKTSHSLGLAMCRDYLAAKGVKLNGKYTDKKYLDIAKYIAERLHPGLDEEEKRFKAMTTVKKLIGFLMAENVDPSDISGIEETASHYGLDITPAMFTWVPYAIEQVIERFTKFGEMDFIDMIYMPVKLKMEPKSKYYYVLTDECQDLNGLQQEISAKLLHAEGRIVVVGDPNQSVYGFSGADAEAFQNLVKRFNTTVYELNTCYRCPTSHIELAQSLVPTIEAAPNAIQGVIEYKHMDNITSMPFGSMVICRLNAPLIASYFQFIAAEKPAVIIGRDMGKGLLALLDKIAEMDGFRYYSIIHFIERYFDMESAKLKTKSNAESKIAQLSDQIACLKVCADNFDCDDLPCFKAKLEALFVDFKDKNLDKSKVVVLCTVHRAKGLEAEHIGLIYQRNSNGDWKNIMPLTWEKQREWELEQEFNIMYVAFTRAKQRLVILGGYKADETPDLTIGFERQAHLELEDDFEDEEEFEIEGDKVYFGLDEGIEEDEEDVMEEPEKLSVFALAEQDTNSHALLESLEEAIEETAPIVVVETESLQPSDPRLEKAHTLLKRTIRALRSAIEATDAVYKKDYLWDAERYGKDFQVAQSQMSDFLFEERDTVLGNEKNRLFTWNNLRDRTYYLLGDDSNLGEVYTHAVKVLQAISKPSIEETIEATPLLLEQAAELFTYGMSRPAMYATCPEDYVKGYEHPEKGSYVDVAAYARRLSREEMKKFEMQPISANAWDVQIGDKVFTTGRTEWTVKEHLKNGKVVVEVEVDGRKESQIEHQWDLTPSAAIATELAPKPLSLGDLVLLNPELPLDKGTHNRAIKVATMLQEAGLWDGKSFLRFDNAYETHKRVVGFEHLSLETLVLTPKDGEILVSLPIENSPADEKPVIEPASAASPEIIPTEPVAWAKWMLANKDRVVILDTETTDMAQNRNNFEIIQLGIINLDGEVVFNRYIRPYVARISSGAMEVHGITNKTLDENGALSLISEYENVKAALDGKIVIAFNSPFDKGALENSLSLSNLPAIEVHSWPCAMRMYTAHNYNKVNRAGRRGTNWSLVEAVAQQGLEVDKNAHDAIADVRMTLALIQSMAQDAPDRWQAVKALPAPKVEAPLIKEGDTVRVKASGVLMTVTRVEGQELNLVDETGWRGKMRIGMVEPAKKPEVFAEPVHEEAAPLVETVLQAESLEAPAPVNLISEPVVIVSQPKKALPIEALEAIIKSLGSREVAIEAKELLSSIIDEVFPA
jgi:DNA helicase-2/ATP-dependent DNA helicase PcrA